jgi:hypothetical protein
MSIGQNPFTETIYFRKYSVYEGFLGENTRLRELRCRREFGRFWALVGILGFSGLFLQKYAVYKGFLAMKYSFTVTISCKRVLSDTRTARHFADTQFRPSSLKSDGIL